MREDVQFTLDSGHNAQTVCAIFCCVVQEADHQLLLMGWDSHTERWADTHLGLCCQEPEMCGCSHTVNLSLTLLLLISNSCTEALHPLQTGFLVQYLNVFEMGLSCERGTRVLHCIHAKEHLENWKIFYVYRDSYSLYYTCIIFVS